jgi:hypothetical protein
MDFWICSSCSSTFLPTRYLAAIQRKLFQPTRQLWFEFLKSRIDPELRVDAKCIQHSNPLRRQVVPEYAHEAYIVDCCDLIHLRPSEMCKILEIGLEFRQKIGGRKATREGVNKMLATPLFLIESFFQKKSNSEVDDFETMQFDLKLKPLLMP